MPSDAAYGHIRRRPPYFIIHFTPRNPYENTIDDMLSARHVHVLPHTTLTLSVARCHHHASFHHTPPTPFTPRQLWCAVVRRQISAARRCSGAVCGAAVKRCSAAQRCAGAVVRGAAVVRRRRCVVLALLRSAGGGGSVFTPRHFTLTFIVSLVAALPRRPCHTVTSPPPLLSRHHAARFMPRELYCRYVYMQARVLMMQRVR